MRYKLYSYYYTCEMWMQKGKPIGSAMRLADLSEKLSAVAQHGFKDWYVYDEMKKVYVDPETVKKLTGINAEGDGYPVCPCCHSMGISHADHTFLPNCLAKR